MLPDDFPTTREAALALAREYLPDALARRASGWEDVERVDFTYELDVERCVYAGVDPSHGLGVTVGYGWTTANSIWGDDGEPEAWVTVYEDGHTQDT